MSASTSKSKVLYDKPAWTEPAAEKPHLTASKTRWDVMKEIILDCAADTTCHGLPKIVTNKYWSIKVMWMFCLSFSVAYFVYGVVDSIFSFLNYDTNSVIVFERKASVECTLKSFSRLD
jgi:hypothetical protein